MANLATREAILGKKIKIITPFLNLSKAEIIQKGIKLGVDYSMTKSCYRLSKKGFACGICDSCILRKKGFQDANIADPTTYYETF